MTDQSSNFENPGQRYKDFEVIKSTPIPELQCRLIELIHLPSNAQVIHIANEDPENLFCLSFQTLPETSNGVAHILEHTVLCGSKKFPVKDPFFAMTRRSLNTFMNALTGADFTCYPAATQVEKDFYNLLDVYLDAVFHPKINKLSFLQEGHRLEFSTADDPSTPLEFKGIVFNEMKGALASSSARLYETINQALFPDITYGINSGGDPKDIPKLTYEELKEFHGKYYHPSRCLFFFYGNLPLEGHLDFISRTTLNFVQKKPPLPPLPLQPRFKEPKRIIDYYPIPVDEEKTNQTTIAFSWLTCHIKDQMDLLALCLIENILLDNDASQLKLAFLKSGFCKQVGAYMETDNSEVPFVITLRGCEPEHADILEKLLFDTLKEVEKNGIPNQLVENALHQMEFHRSEITGGHSPFGLSMFMRSGLLKQHGVDPELGLHIHSLIAEIQQKNRENPNFLIDLLKKYLIDNKHFVRVVMIPDSTLADQELLAEKTVLEEIKKNLTKEQTESIINTAADLAAFQAKQEDENPDILPKVTLDDVSKSARSFLLEEGQAGPLQVFHHACFTNEIIYADLVYQLPALSEKDLTYVRLFTILLSQMGCGGRTYAENLEYMHANTGGIGASLVFNMQVQDNNLFHPAFSLKGKALDRKAPQLFKLMYDMATSVDFEDIPRLKEVILKHYTGLQSSLNQNAMRYAVNLAAGGLTTPLKVAHEWYGMPYYWKIKEIAENFDNHLPDLLLILNRLKEQLLCLDNPHLIITSNKETYKKAVDKGFYGLKAIPVKPFSPWKADYASTQVPSQGRIIASPIAFTAKVFKTIPYVHPDSAALNIAASLFDNLFLHTKLREQGGAYGGGAVSNTMSGIFYFYAYRDPNIASTLEAFNEAIEFILNGNFSLIDLEEAKLEMLQGMDAPVSPGNRGELAYTWLCEGKSFSLRQAFRDRLLSLTKEDVTDAIRDHILPFYEASPVVAFAGKELLERENEVLVAKGLAPLIIERI